MAVKEGISQDSLWSYRSTTSPRAVKKPRLVGFWDGSSQAFSAVIYAVTMVSKLRRSTLMFFLMETSTIKTLILTSMNLCHTSLLPKLE